MSCTVCHRAGCTSSFHSIAEQEEHERRSGTLAQELIETKTLLEAERRDRDDAHNAWERTVERVRELDSKCDELRAIIRDGLDLFFEGGEWAPVVQRAQAALSDVPRTAQARNTKDSQVEYGKS